MKICFIDFSHNTSQSYLQARVRNVTAYHFGNLTRYFQFKHSLIQTVCRKVWGTFSFVHSLNGPQVRCTNKADYCTETSVDFSSRKDSVPINCIVYKKPFQPVSALISHFEYKTFVLMTFSCIVNFWPSHRKTSITSLFAAQLSRK